jgi:hypothetical protein
VNGPVAKDAVQALEQKDFTAAAQWVGQEQEQELRQAYERSLEAHQQGGAARDVAERHFMSETVRLHRAAEGFPFTGLKPAGPVSEDIAVAEKALETGDLEPVNALLAKEMRTHTQKLFDQARAARKDRDEGLRAGREWADAYVRYVIYVHGLHQNIVSGPAHGVGD